MWSWGRKEGKKLIGFGLTCGCIFVDDDECPWVELEGRERPLWKRTLVIKPTRRFGVELRVPSG